MNPISDEVTAALQSSLAAHWLAIETYVSQAAHLARIGYTKLAARAAEDANEEREHATKLLARLEAFGLAPEFAHRPPEWPRNDVPGIFTANLALENEAASIERAGIIVARGNGDDITAELLSDNLAGSESSIIEIEAQQALIAQMGLENYLANQT